jgi:hypothetical protein
VQGGFSKIRVQDLRDFPRHPGRETLYLREEEKILGLKMARSLRSFVVVVVDRFDCG